MRVTLPGNKLDQDPSEEQATPLASVLPQQVPGAITVDPTLQYQLRADENGQVTYRVVQLAHDGSDAAAQIVGGPTPFPGHQPALHTPPFSNGGSPTLETGERFAYYPTVAATGDAPVVVPQTDPVNAAGQFYVMMSPQDMIPAPPQRQIAPRATASPKIEGGRSSRDDRRRATHNEVERRRRNKINNWIVQLAKLVPECSQEPIKQTQASKGGILSKACEYIQELRSTNNRLAESLKSGGQLNVDNDILRQQCDKLKQENALLREQLRQVSGHS